MKAGIIIQARTSSTRLPNKVLLPLPMGGTTSVLEQVIRRMKKVGLSQHIIIATTSDEEDKAIEQIAQKEGVQSFRGSKDNVLERYYLAAKEYKLDHIVRVTSDCPCIDPEVVELVLQAHVHDQSDYTSNILLNKYPHGYDAEVMTFAALERAYREATDLYDKEHVTPYIYRTHPEKFKILKIEAPDYCRNSNIRITLDTRQDYTFLCGLYDSLYEGNKLFSILEVFNLIKAKPWLALINNDVQQKKKFESEKEELIEAMKVLKLNEMWRVIDRLASF